LSHKQFQFNVGKIKEFFNRDRIIIIILSVIIIGLVISLYAMFAILETTKYCFGVILEMVTSVQKDELMSKEHADQVVGCGIWMSFIVEAGK